MGKARGGRIAVELCNRRATQPMASAASEAGQQFRAAVLAPMAASRPVPIFSADSRFFPGDALEEVGGAEALCLVLPLGAQAFVGGAAAGKITRAEGRVSGHAQAFAGEERRQRAG